MRQLPDSTSPQWLRVGTELVAVQVLSRWHSWRAHFDYSLNCKVRCGGVRCSYCDSGSKPLLLFVLGCAHARHGRVLLELRERHRDLIGKMNEHELEGIGFWLRLAKSSLAVNASLNAEIYKWEPAEEWDIQHLVDSLGLKPLRESPISATDSSLSAGTREDVMTIT